MADLCEIDEKSLHFSVINRNYYYKIISAGENPIVRGHSGDLSICSIDLVIYTRIIYAEHRIMLHYVIYIHMTYIHHWGLHESEGCTSTMQFLISPPSHPPNTSNITCCSRTNDRKRKRQSKNEKPLAVGMALLISFGRYHK